MRARVRARELNPNLYQVLFIVRTLATSLRVPVFCKIRLQDELHDTLTYCRQLKEAYISPCISPISRLHLAYTSPGS